MQCWLSSADICESNAMDPTTTLGFVAAALSTLAFVPQVIKAWRTRSTGDISLAMFATVVAGSLLWIAYAWLKSDLPVLATNGIIFTLASSILYLKIKHG
jgi:MtN3 and saliva related transmembrane protein